MIQNIPHQTKCILKIALIGENLRLMLEHLELNQAQPEAACWLEDLVEQSDSIRDWLIGSHRCLPPVVSLPLPRSLFAGARREQVLTRVCLDRGDKRPIKKRGVR
jgi:hypothetical protein